MGVSYLTAFAKPVTFQLQILTDFLASTINIGIRNANSADQKFLNFNRIKQKL